MTTFSSFGNGDVFLWMLEFFLFVIWFWLLIAIFSDLFRDHETSGGVKVLWVIFLILLPFLGILIYLLVRGHGMAAPGRRAAEGDAGGHGRPDPRDCRSSSSAADQIAQAKSLLDCGAITQAEFDAMKSKALTA